MEVLDLLTKYDFEKGINYENVLNKLKEGNTLIHIENFPLEDQFFQSFIKNYGISIKENRNNNREDIFDVKISTHNGNFYSIANSNLEFPLHTDCADYKIIPNCIGLLCVTPAIKNEGISKFVFLDKVLPQLSEKEKIELISKKWNFRNQRRSILNIEKNRVIICYDRITLESFSEINSVERNLLNKLDDIFEEYSFQIKLKSGDLILFRNDLMLHGRTGIDIKSERLIKRIRFSLKNFA
jgi:hypothetical protein